MRRSLAWLHQQPPQNSLLEVKRISSVFPDGPHPSDDNLDIIIANMEGMLYSILQSYLTDFMSVLELVDNLGDLDYYVYKRKVRKGAHCADIS